VGQSDLGIKGYHSAPLLEVALIAVFKLDGNPITGFGFIINLKACLVVASSRTEFSSL